MSTDKPRIGNDWMYAAYGLALTAFGGWLAMLCVGALHSVTSWFDAASFMFMWGYVAVGFLIAEVGEYRKALRAAVKS